MRVALVSEWDTSDPNAWSGVVRPMRDSLRDVVDLEPVRLQSEHHIVDKALARTHGIFGRRYLPGHSVATARLLGKQLRFATAGQGFDAVLAVAASTAVAMARLDVPVVHVTDTTVELIRDYYPLYSGLGRLAVAQAEWLERRSQQRTGAVVATSHWARASFVDHYGMAADRVTVAPFGPAITPGADRGSRTTRETGGLAGLLVASHWERKGGEQAVDAIGRLREAGIDATLTVVGECPAGLPEWVLPVGKLGREELSRAYLRHDVLLELARANAGGVTLTDAAAHGLPVIATDTGGVADIVVHQGSGILVTTEQDEDAALTAMLDSSTRQHLSNGAIDRYRNILNWDAWAGHVHDLLCEVASSDGRGRETIIA